MNLHRGTQNSRQRLGPRLRAAAQPRATVQSYIKFRLTPIGDARESQYRPLRLRWAFIEEHTMNRNQMKGAVKDVAGKVQRKVGELTGNKTQQAKGAAKQVEGKMQRGAGNVEEALDKADRKTR